MTENNDSAQNINIPNPFPDKRKLRLITPCSPDCDIACWIKGAHLTEQQCVEYLKSHKYYAGTQIKSVIIGELGYCKKVIFNDSNRDPDYECEGKVAWYPCGSHEPGATPTTVIEFIEFGD